MYLDENLYSDENSLSDSSYQSHNTPDSSIELPSVQVNAAGSPRLKRILEKKRRKTHLRRKDKHISPKMMHILWFAGLRGAVAYACVRDFPNVLGHNDEFIAATVVIVLGTIIGMGGVTEALLRYLQVSMDVNEDDYMEEWHKTKELKGTFHYFEQHYIYGFVSRDHAISSEASAQKEMPEDDKKSTDMESAYQYTLSSAF